MEINKFNKNMCSIILSLLMINTVSNFSVQSKHIYISEAATHGPLKCSNRVRFTKNIELRKSTSSSTAKLATVKKGTVLTVQMHTPSWYKITYNNKTGWVLKSATTLTATGTKCSTKITTTANLNLREDVSTDSRSLIVIPKGAALTATAYTPSWYKVTYKNKTGWIYRSCTKGGEPVKTKGTSCSLTVSATENLNIRKEASTNTQLIATIPKGKTVKASAQTDSWYKVTYNNKTGWVNKKYTKVVSNSTNSSSSNSSSSSSSKNPTVDNSIKSYELVGYKGKTTAELNMRYSDSATSQSLGMIPKDKNITLLKDSIFSPWYQVKYNNTVGWVSKMYVEVLAPVNAASNPLYRPSTVKPVSSGDTFDKSKVKPTQSEVFAIIEKYAKKHNVSASLFKAVVKAESNFNHQCISHAGAVGLIQLMPVTAREMGLTVNSKVDMRWDPEKNIEAGIKYIKKYYDILNKEYGNKSWDRALAAYNAGPNAVRKYNGKIPPYKETQDYVKKINQYKSEY